MPHRSQNAYDRFSAAVGLPMTVLALLWLPVLVIPFVVTLRPDVTAAFEAIDYFVWACFVVEYLVRLWLRNMSTSLRQMVSGKFVLRRPPEWGG
jgi:hypothetical protein